MSDTNATQSVVGWKTTPLQTPQLAKEGSRYREPTGQARNTIAPIGGRLLWQAVCALILVPSRAPPSHACWAVGLCVI